MCVWEGGWYLKVQQRIWFKIIIVDLYLDNVTFSWLSAALNVFKHLTNIILSMADELLIVITIVKSRIDKIFWELNYLRFRYRLVDILQHSFNIATQLRLDITEVGSLLGE